MSWSDDVSLAPRFAGDGISFTGVLRNVITVGGWDVYTYQMDDGARIEFRRGDEVQVAYLKDGLDGLDGKTPQRGIDYGTADDVAAIVQAVLGQLPTWEGGSY